MTPTPETDNAADGGNYVHILVSQRLERERDKLKVKLELCRKALEYYERAPWYPYTKSLDTNFALLANRTLIETQ